MSKSYLEKADGSGPRLFAIETGKDFIVREHVEGFCEVVLGLSKVVSGHTFHKIVDGHGHGALRYSLRGVEAIDREPLPFEGVVVVAREKVGIDPYQGPRELSTYPRSQQLAQYAVEAGSIVHAALACSDTTYVVNAAVIALTEQVLSQISR